MKRPAAAMSEERAIKRAREEACRGIAEVVKGAEGFPADAMRMVGNAVADCLARPKPERHAYQQGVTDWVGEVLAAVRGGAAGKLSELEARAGGSDAEQLKRAAAAEAAAEDLKAKRESRAAAKTALDEASAASVAAKAASEEAEAAQKEGDEAFGKAGGNKERLEAALTGDYAAVKASQGAWKVVKALIKLGKEFDFDTQLLDFAGEALTKLPADRGTFDGFVISELDAQFASSIAGFAEVLAKGEAAKAERDAKCAAAAEAEKAASAREAESEAALDAAVAALAEAEAAKKAADHAVKAFGPDMKQLGRDAASAKEDLTHVDLVLASFRELADRETDTPPEPPAAPEDGADAAADGADAPADGAGAGETAAAAA